MSANHESDYFDLSDLGLLKVSGNDAKKFLQGQLTCDLEKLQPLTASLTAHCNPQGRVLLLAYLFQFQQAYYLLMLRTMVPIALTALKKYAVFFKAMQLSDASDEIKLLGAQETAHTDAIKLPSPATGFLIVGQTAENPTDTQAWLCHLLRCGLPTLYPETSGKFLPHELNLQYLNGIDFDKGCYTGQEIIARMHYRGKLKKQLYLAEIATQSPPALSANIYCNQAEEIKVSGTVVDTCQQAYNKLYNTLILIDDCYAEHKLFLENHPDEFFILEKRKK